MAGLEKHGFEFDWVENADEWSAGQMAEYPAVILAKANNTSSTDETPWMSESVQQGFLEYLNSGMGLLVLHSGTAGYQNTERLRALMGGVFREHPDQCPVTMEPIEGHPLTEGCEAFSLLDEHYQMDMDDMQADIFLITKSEYGTQPGGWRRFEGEGRVCVLTPSHNLEVWQTPSHQRLLLNTLRWCCNPN